MLWVFAKDSLHKLQGRSLKIRATILYYPSTAGNPAIPQQTRNVAAMG